MPVYEYRCKNCDNNFSEMKKISERLEPTLEDCSSCKTKSLYISIGTPNSMDLMRTTYGTGKNRPTDEFREVVRRIKKTYPGAKRHLKDY